MPSHLYPCAFCGKPTKSHQMSTAYHVYVCHGCFESVGPERLQRLKDDLRKHYNDAVLPMLLKCLPKMKIANPKKAVPLLKMTGTDPNASMGIDVLGDAGEDRKEGER